MKLLVVLVAIAILPLDSFGNEFTRCTALFQAAGRIEDSFAATKIIRENDEAYFNATESEMTKAEWDHLVYIFREKTKRLQGRTVTHMGKTAVSEGNKVTVSQTLIGNKRSLKNNFQLITRMAFLSLSVVSCGLCLTMKVV